MIVKRIDGRNICKKSLFDCIQLTGFNYCHLTLTIYFNIGHLSGATTPSQSRPGSNDNEGILQLPKISKTGASQSDAV